MSKIYLDLPVVSSIPEAYQKSATGVLEFTGHNIGNLAFRHALHSFIDLDDYQCANYRLLLAMLDAGIQPEEIIISAANWLCETEDYERSNGARAKALESTDCPIITFGVGAQAQHGAPNLNLGPNTTRLAHILSERCSVLSVRDEFTQAALEKMGIINTVITGCPSNFLNLDPFLGDKLSDKASKLLSSSPSWRRIRAHISEVTGGRAYSGKAIASTLQFLRESPSFYVVQTPVILPILLGETDVVPPGYLTNAPPDIRDPNNMRRLIKAKVMAFSSIDAWMDFCRTCDVATGMRIHGNMIPLQSGVPSAVAVHDSRTVGLANFMNVPHVSTENMVEILSTSPVPLLEVIVNGIEGYDARRKDLAKVWLGMLKANSMRVRDEFEQFANN